MENTDFSQVAAKAFPWLAGAVFAGGQLVLSLGCTVPGEGRCTGCGGCMAALAGLTGWAVVRGRRSEASDSTAP